MFRRLFLVMCFLISYFSTKIVGLDATIHWFKRMGLMLRRLTAPKTSEELDQLFNSIEMSYRLIPLAIRCLDQAIVTWFYFNLKGHPSSLKIGVNIRPFESHAWVESGTRKFVTIATLADLEVIADYEPW